MYTGTTFNYHTYFSTECKKRMSYCLVDKALVVFHMLTSLSEITQNDNSSICCLFSDFGLDASLLLPIFFAFVVFHKYLFSENITSLH